MERGRLGIHFGKFYPHLVELKHFKAKSGFEKEWQFYPHLVELKLFFRLMYCPQGDKFYPHLVELKHSFLFCL